MNQALSKEQLAELSVPAPVVTMSRAAKIERWARLVEKTDYNFYIFHRLEYMSEGERDAQCHPGSAFAVAANDPVLKDAGLAGPTIGDAKKFFEISDQQLHAFSCDCSGHISNNNMAARIRGLDAGAGTRRIVASLMMAFMVGGLTSLATIGLLHL